MEIKVSGETETQQKVNPPTVPAPVGDRAAKKVIVHLEATEEEGELADGVTYNSGLSTVQFPELSSESALVTK